MSPRPLDLDFEDATRAAGGKLVHFVEFATPGTGGGRLERVREGYIQHVEFDEVSSLHGFTVLSGTWQLVHSAAAGKQVLRGCNNGLIRWDSGPQQTRGRMLQYVARRHPAQLGQGGAPVLLAGVHNQASPAWFGISSYLGSFCAFLEHTLYFCSLSTLCLPQIRHIQGFFSPLYGMFRYGGPGGLEGWVGPETFGIGHMRTSVSVNTTVEGPLALWARNRGNFGPDPCNPGCVDFEQIAAYRSDEIRVLGAPPGSVFFMEGPGRHPQAAFVGPVSSGLSGIGGTGMGTIRIRGHPQPFTTVRLAPGVVGNLASLSPPGGVWGGDIYQFHPPDPEPILNVCTADVRLRWDEKLWTGVGRENLGFTAAQESPDKRAQGLDIQFSAVDTTAILDELRDTRHRGGMVRVWQGYWEAETGKVLGEPTLIFQGFSQGGFEAEEFHPDGDDPPHATVTARIASRLAELDLVEGIRTNTESHQRFHPGDTFMQNVPLIMDKEIFWGRRAPRTDQRKKYIMPLPPKLKPPAEE